MVKEKKRKASIVSGHGLQAECEELAQRVDVLKEENASLRTELNRIKKEHDELLSQNNSLKVMVYPALVINLSTYN